MKTRIMKILFILFFAVMMGALNNTKIYGEDNITIEKLVGIWQQYSEVPWAIQFNEDGTFRSAHTVLRLENIPMDEGRFELEGSRLSIISEGDCAGSCKGLRGIYQVVLTETGKLDLIEQKDQCRERASYCSQYWFRVSP